jgi:hypothetical protein
MKRESPKHFHPLMRDREAFEKAVIRSVASSTAIETGESVSGIERRLRKAVAAEGVSPGARRRR